MATKNSATNEEVLYATSWLKDNPDITIQAVEALKLEGLRLSDATHLDPRILVRLANATLAKARKAKAPKEVLRVLKLRAELTEAGLSKLPRFAYTWLVCGQLRGVKGTARAQAVLRKGAAAAPDARNRALLEQLATTAFRRRPSSNGTLPSCLLCCAIACLECALFCPECCVVACLLCQLA